MKVLEREQKGKSVHLVVRDVSPNTLSKTAAGWVIDRDAGGEVLVRMPVSGGPKNVDTRAKRLAETHGAIDLSDDAAVLAALGTDRPPVRKKVTSPKPVNQAALMGDTSPWDRGRDPEGEGDDDEEDDGEDDGEDPLDAMLDEGGDDEGAEDEDEEGDEAEDKDEDEVDEAELDEKLLELDWDPELIDQMTIEKKTRLVAEGKRPPRVVKKSVRAHRDSKSRREALRQEEAVEKAAEKAAETPAESVPEAPEATADPVPEEGPDEDPPPPVRPHGRRVTSEEPVRTSRRRNLAPEPAPSNGNGAPVTRPPTRGWRVQVWRKDWPLLTAADGSKTPRKYDVGDTPDEEEAQAIAARWKAAGFAVEIAGLPWHHKAPRAKHTIWTDEPYDPILCHVPGCTWVGDHFAPHLRIHGMDMGAYVQMTNYQGPMVVGRGTVSLGQAHEAIRRRNDIHSGQFIAEVRGTNAVEVWRVVKHHQKPTGEVVDGKPVIEHSFSICPIEQGSETIVVQPVELFGRFKPIGTWAHRLLRDMGVEKRRG